MPLPATLVEPQVIVLLMLVAGIAGFVDAIAGGGGLITLPSLLLAGLNPLEALATNKVQGVFGSAASSHAFYGAGHLQLRPLIAPIAMALAGGALGASAVRGLDITWLRAVIPILLIAVSIYFAIGIRPHASSDGPVPLPVFTAAILGGIIGFYDGFFGPGAGSFFMLGLAGVAGLPLLQATANTKALNFASNAGSLLVFAFSGHVLYPVGLAMGAGQIVGARLGARTAIRKGAWIIRPFVIAVALAIALRLLIDPANPIGQMLFR